MPPMPVAALVDGGLRAVEITLRTSAALDTIRLAAADVPAAVVGVGSVTTAAALHAAVDAGARFAVSPGIDDRVIDAARDREIPFLPGIATATELMHAVDRGIDVVKVFPAEPLGGPAIIEAFAAVWPDVRFVPTGDRFASGVIHGLLSAATLAEALEIGIAHGALVMTTPGDTSSVDQADVMRLVAGDDAGVVR